MLRVRDDNQNSDKVWLKEAIAFSKAVIQSGVSQFTDEVDSLICQGHTE